MIEVDEVHSLASKSASTKDTFHPVEINYSGKSLFN